MAKRIKDLKSPTTAFRDRVKAIVMKPFASLSDRQTFWLAFAVFCLVTALLIQNPLWRRAGESLYHTGDIARETIVSPADITVTDQAETERLRAEARSKVNPIFRYESGKSDEALQSFISAWEHMQRRTAPAANANKQPDANARTDDHWTTSDIGKVLSSRTFSRNELDAVQSALRDAAEGYIYDDSEKQYFQTQVFVFDRSKPTQRSTVSMPESNWTALSAARNKLRVRIDAIRSLSKKEADAFYAATEILVTPTVQYDSVATETARNTAASDIEPVTIALKRGENIVDEGHLITPNIMSKIEAIGSYTASTRQLNRFIGVLLLVTGLFWASWKFVQNRGTLPRLSLTARRTFFLIGFVVICQTVISSVLFRLADLTAVQNVRAPMNDATLWAFAIPFGAASLLMTLLADRPTALFVGLLNSMFAGLMAPRPLEFVFYSSIASAVAVYGIGRYRNRQTVTIAGSLVGAVSAVLSLAILAYTQQPIILNTVLLSIACGLAGGILTAAVTSVLLPVCESIFGILTDVKLLELSNADLPVLGQLALRAPGTNQHSHAVGQLAEEACRVVGANGLLARIGALYHDIGKTAAPEHFVENQMSKNPHDKLKPAQSAKIIISHVTYGTKLAREVGLPARIVDFIPQHHGTRTLHYFLKKAQAEARPDEVISENDFRYPGPKPQFKEAAIMMIADSCEAGARSLAEPSPENVRFIVTKIIDAILQDDQLDECDLTLRELTQIRESMIKSLVAIYHSRVDYPGYVPPPSGTFRLVDTHIDSEERGLKFTNPADIPVSPGGEIEDEAIDRSHPPKDHDVKAAG